MELLLSYRHNKNIGRRGLLYFMRRFVRRRCASNLVVTRFERNTGEQSNFGSLLRVGQTGGDGSFDSGGTYGE